MKIITVSLLLFLSTISCAMHQENSEKKARSLVRRHSSAALNLLATQAVLVAGKAGEVGVHKRILELRSESSSELKDSTHMVRSASTGDVVS